MYISIRNNEIKTWGNLLSFATNEVTLYLNEEGYIEQRCKPTFTNEKIISSYPYNQKWKKSDAVLDYLWSEECKDKLQSQGYKLYDIKEIII